MNIAAYTKIIASTPKAQLKFAPTKKRVMTVVDIIAEHPELKQNSLLMSVVQAYLEAFISGQGFRN